MIAIVTDSTVYMTREEAQIYGVRIVPISYNVNGNFLSETYSDCNPHYVRHVFKDASCFTVQPNIAAYLAVFKEFLKKGYRVLCLTLSSKLSAAYHNAVIAAKSLESPDVSVFDTRLTAGGMYMLVRKARTFAIAGMSLEEIAEELTRLREGIEIRFSVEDLSYLKNGKRLSGRRKSSSLILSQKPICAFSEGAIVLDETARNGVDQFRRLVEGIGPDTDYVIVHYVRKSKAIEDVMNYLHVKYPSMILEMRPLGPVVGIHIGYAIVGLVWSSRKRSDKES